MRSIYHFSMPAPGSKIYEAFQYPAGEWQVRIRPEELAAIAKADEIRITARPMTSDGIVQLALLADAVRDVNDEADYVLGLPYLPYGRADRTFVDGDCFGLSVFGSLINTMRFRCVRTLDVHSLGAFMASFGIGAESASPLPFIERAIADFATRNKASEINVLFPDKGARDRYHLSGSVSCNSRTVSFGTLNCDKRRDAESGVLSGFTVPAKKALGDRPTLIVDDICDGGGTFLGIADELKRERLGLYVTHGIFSKGTTILGSRFERIYTTDSIERRGSVDDCCTIYPCGQVLYAKGDSK